MKGANLDALALWINDYSGKYDNVCYIKFYRGISIVSTRPLQDGQFYEVRTWFGVSPEYGKIPKKSNTRTRKASCTKDQRYQEHVQTWTAHT